MPRRGSSATAGVSKYKSDRSGLARDAVSFSVAEGPMLQAAIVGATEAGDCIMFARTSDGGALSVRILTEGLVEKWYPATVDELRDVLVGIVEATGQV